MDTNPSRRALIGGVGLAAVLAGVPAIATATVNPGTSDGAWGRLVAAYTGAKADWDAAYSVLEDAQFGFRDLAKPQEPQLVGEVLTSMTIDQIRAMPFDRDWQEYEAERDAWTAQRDARRQAAYGHLEHAEEIAKSRYTDMLTALKAYPAPTLAILREKMELLEADYGEGGEDSYAKHVFADLRRLAGRAAA